MIPSLLISIPTVLWLLVGLPCTAVAMSSKHAAAGTCIGNHLGEKARLKLLAKAYVHAVDTHAGGVTPQKVRAGPPGPSFCLIAVLSSGLRSKPKFREVRCLLRRTCDDSSPRYVPNSQAKKTAGSDLYVSRALLRRLPARMRGRGSAKGRDPLSLESDAAQERLRMALSNGSPAIGQNGGDIALLGANWSTAHLFVDSTGAHNEQHFLLVMLDGVMTRHKTVHAAFCAGDVQRSHLRTNSHSVVELGSRGEVVLSCPNIWSSSKGTSKAHGTDFLGTLIADYGRRLIAAGMPGDPKVVNRVAHPCALFPI